MSQLTFAEAEYKGKKHKTRREKFPELMDQLIPCGKLERQVARKYSRSKVGCKPYLLLVMLRLYALQLPYNLSDLAMGDALYEIESIRRFAGLGLAGHLPDETMILHFHTVTLGGAGATAASRPYRRCNDYGGAVVHREREG